MSSNASTPGIACSAAMAARKSAASAYGLSVNTTWWRMRSALNFDMARQPTRRSSLHDVVDLLEPVHRRVDALGPRLELQRQVQRVMPRLMEIPAVEPQRLLLGRLP